MKALAQYILAVIVSFEFVLIALVFALIIFWPNILSPVSEFIVDDADVLKHIALLPSVLAIWVFSESRKLLFPDEDKKRLLQKWGDYWKWRIHFNVTIFYAVMFAGGGLVSWVLGMKASTPTGFVFLFAPVIGALIVALSVYLARITLSEIIVSSE